MRRIALTGIVAALVMAAPASAGCNTKACEKRVQIKHKRKVVKPYLGWLKNLAACETRGFSDDPSSPRYRFRVNTGNGHFGAYQFKLATWQGIGGHGYPHQAGKLEQQYRAILLLKRSGAGQWECRA